MTKIETNERKDWNAMIYLAGENNLGEACIFALKGMKRALPSPDSGITNGNSDKRVKIVAQLDAGGLGGDEVRYILRRDDKHPDLNDDEITRRDTTQTTYRGVLKDFVSSSITIDGLANHYLLVLSGHGGGPNEDFLGRDVESPDTLSIPKVQWALGQVKDDVTQKFGKEEGDKFKINVLGLDSCMMSTAEIGYQLREYVDFMVGAEGFEPNMGWPYERIASEILSKPTMAPRDLAITIVEKYVTFYSDFIPAGRSVDQAACDLTKFEALAEVIKGLADVLIAKLDDAETMRQIVLAHWEAQSYKDDQFVDLYDFCDLLDVGPTTYDNPTGSVVMRGSRVDADIVKACREVKRILKNDKNGADSAVLRSCYSGPAVQYSHGLSIYFPWSHVVDSYNNLEFATRTNWKEFLCRYIEKTRREMRRCWNPQGRPTVKGRLFFNPSVSGFDFLLTGGNRSAPTFDRILSNKVGTMKNPAIDFVPCKCGQGDDSTSDKGSGDNAPARKTQEKSPYPSDQ